MIASVVAACSAAVLASGGGPEHRGGAGLLVIAPAAFAADLNGFLIAKQAAMPAELVSLESALAKGTGPDDPARLKRYLYERWRAGGVGYVLLVGDADTLPVRYMVLDRVTEPAFHYAFYPSDLYYADLAKPDGTFEDWNGAKDGFHAGYFGEVRGEKNKSDPINYDAIDYRPEIAVGRWPVSTGDEARRVAEKTLVYETGVRTGEKPGARRAAFVATGGWVENRPAMDTFASRLPAGWVGERLYWAGNGRDDKTIAPDEAGVLDLLNQGLGLVVHSGHGSDHHWDGSIGEGTLAKLKNADRLPVLFSAGCSTARFATLPPYEAYVDVDGREHAGTNSGEVFSAPPPPPACYQKGRYNPTGFGEQLLRAGPGGAVAYIGCNTGSQPCGMTLADGFMEALGSAPAQGTRLGDCWVAAVTAYYTKERLADLKPNEDWYPPSIFFQGMKFMLYGDPTLTMPGPAPK